jgi:hypothetical protein
MPRRAGSRFLPQGKHWRGKLQCGEEGLGTGVVAEGLAEVGEAVDVAGAEDEGATQLEGVAAEFVLAVAGGLCTFAAFEIVAAKEMENVSGLEVGEFVCPAVLVNEKGEVDAGFLLKYAAVVSIAEADGGKRGVFSAEGLLVLAQLRDVLAAEDSAVMAEENEDSGIRFPERAEADGFAERVGKNNAGESLAEGFGHKGND